MKNEPTKSVSSQVILGLFVIGLGLLFLLDNLDIFEYRRIFAFWPSVFILIGVIKLTDTKSANGKVIGGALIAIGTLLTLNHMGFLSFNWRNLWPLVIIGVGGSVVYRALWGRKQLESAPKADQDSDSVVDITAIVGGFDRRITTPNFRGGEVTAVAGGAVLDLRGSSIEGEAVINVFVAMGGVTLKVPPDWTVILHGTPILGGFDEKTIVPPNNTKRLIVKGYAIMGGVEVRN
jgi:hypothetical protein